MVKIEGYEIFAELQRGAWVTLFKAFDLQQQRTVLIKLLNDEHAPAAVQEQLLVESALRDRLLHPNLRRVFTAGDFAKRPYLVLEYVEGPTLAELLTPRLPIEFCAWVVKQVAQALMAVHREGILHRDVKPRNIFVSWEGEVKLGDLGLAVEADEVSMSLAGTPAYLSPEIVLGQKISASSDLFALGAVLYEMLTAAPPFADHTTSAILHRIANLEPTPISKLRPEAPAELAALCRTLLSKSPAARCRDAEEVVAILTHFEHTYRLKTSAESFALYLRTPEHYAPVKFLPASSSSSPLLEPRPSSAPQPRRENKNRRAYVFLLSAVLVLGLVLSNWGRNQPEATTESRGEPQPGKLATSEKITVPAILPENQEHPLSAPETSTKKIASVPTSTTAESEANTPAASAISVPEKIAAEILPGPRLLLLSEPRASVYVESTLLGVTPLRWTMPQREQVYELRFLAPMLPEVRTLVTAAIIESDTLRLNLWKELSYLEVTVNPWGELWLDGKPVDTTPLVAP
ncbi:MAG: serine/threonine-protein kinase, partial [candidate division KSB1 bacterium]